MQIVPPDVSNRLARTSGSMWMEQAFGEASALETRIGPSWQGDYLPGLDEVHAWGLVEPEVPVITGALVTGFQPSPSSLSFMLSALCHEDQLDLFPLERVLELLPQQCLDALVLRSLSSEAKGTRVLDRDTTVLETGSRAVALCVANIVQKLVVGAEVTLVDAALSAHPTLYVRTLASGLVSDFILAHTAPPGVDWRPISDWRYSPP